MCRYTICYTMRSEACSDPKTQTNCRRAGAARGSSSSATLTTRVVADLHSSLRSFAVQDGRQFVSRRVPKFAAASGRPQRWNVRHRASSGQLATFMPMEGKTGRYGPLNHSQLVAVGTHAKIKCVPHSRQRHAAANKRTSDTACELLAQRSRQQAYISHNSQRQTSERLVEQVVNNPVLQATEETVEVTPPVSQP